MATKSKPRPVLDEGDRHRIGNAREVLQEYGLYVDVADMSDVAYEQRMVRKTALELACAAAPHISPVGDGDLLTMAEGFYDFIWKGEK